MLLISCQALSGKTLIQVSSGIRIMQSPDFFRQKILTSSVIVHFKAGLKDENYHKPIITPEGVQCRLPEKEKDYYQCWTWKCLLYGCHVLNQLWVQFYQKESISRISGNNSNVDWQNPLTQNRGMLVWENTTRMKFIETALILVTHSFQDSLSVSFVK